MGGTQRGTNSRWQIAGTQKQISDLGIKWEELKMSEVINILGIAGSLRRNSYNRAALRAAQQLVPDDATLDIFELDGIPVFNEDDEKQPPARVVEFKKQIRAADAILLVTPEYNYSIPGI